MKTAIYIPDDIFSRAEKIAKRLKISRSELYSKAIKEFVNHISTENITQRLNAVYGGQENDSKIDKQIHSAQLNIMEKEEW
ncbi:MAG: hypothetical protein GY950_29820 [bacterium]|nr:hypothetical protein [bacterium]